MKSFIFLIISVLLIACNPHIQENQVTVIPVPVSLEVRKGSFEIDQQTKIIPGIQEMNEMASYLTDFIKTSYGIALEVEGTDKVKSNFILIKLDTTDEELGDEGYRLKAEKKGITISAAKPAGIFYGIQTFKQLIRKDNNGATFPAVDITDYPRFRWRGYLLDPARHFRTKDEIKRYIDLIALCKMNTMQLHLTDDQGWRLEIRKYPELTLKGSLSDNSGRKGSGWYYTQEDIRELVQYAESRFVTLVPEIEMPGHSLAATSVYPHLGCEGQPASELCVSKETTGQFSRDVLTEVMSLFPSPYIHVGADEVRPERWRSCPSCSLKIRQMLSADPENNLLSHNVKVTSGAGMPYHKDISLLQGWYNRGIDRHISASNRRMVGWDEIMDGGLDRTSNAIVMAWRSEDAIRGAIRLGRNVIVSLYPDYYLDNDLSLERTYTFDPVPVGLSSEEEKLILGVQGNMWGEGTPTVKEIDQRTFPRLAAIAETGWSQPSGKDFPSFTDRLKPFGALLETFGVLTEGWKE